jgi:archaellum component FlaC
MSDKEMDYLTFMEYYFHLTECFRFAIELQKELLKEKTKVGEILGCFSGMNAHIEKLPQLSRKEINELGKKVKDCIEHYKEYGDPRYPLEPKDKEMLQITVIELMEILHSLQVIGIKSIQDPSELIVPAKKFPNKIAVKMGEMKRDMDETFVIGRVSEGDKDYIAIRKFPYEMSFKELMGLVESEDKFKVRYKFDIELKGRFKYLRASRIHLVIWHDGSCYRMADISRTYTIVDIDGDRRRIAGYRASINQPLLTLPLGKQNKIWICGTPDETPVEIFTQI